MLRLLYTTLVTFALPLLPLRLWWRGRREPGYRAHIAERFGRYRTTVDRPVIWLHAVSLGETRAAQPLVRAMMRAYPGYQILTTHMTATGRAAAMELWPDMPHVWLPYDHPWLVRRFLAHFCPALGVIMETEVWPNLLAACKANRVPMLLANARLSARSARGYQRTGALAREAFGTFDRIAAQSTHDAGRLASLAAIAPEVTGNIKFDVMVPANAEAVAAELRGLTGTRKVALAASTREGEEALLFDALRSSPLDDALLLVVPRHPQRFDEVAQLARDRGFDVVRRSERRAVPAACKVMIGDSMGEMAAYYRACDVAFIGGSLVPAGAQNLIEACDAGVPVLIGPSTFNFAEATALGIAAGAVEQITSAAHLMTRFAELLADAAARHAIGQHGRAFCTTHRGATERTLALCLALLPPPRSSPPA